MVLLTWLSVPVLGETGKLAPPLAELPPQEISRWVGQVTPERRIEKSIVRRGLISGHTSLRADCAEYLAWHGTLADIPYLIDALSDDSIHVGGRGLYAGMQTTRYWANVALIAISKVDHGFRWDAPEGERQQAIERWKHHWESLKHD